MGGYTRGEQNRGGSDQWCVVKYQPTDACRMLYSFKQTASPPFSICEHASFSIVFFFFFSFFLTQERREIPKGMGLWVGLDENKN